jgi:hypothetical protein
VRSEGGERSGSQLAKLVNPAKRSASRERKKANILIRYDPRQGFAFPGLDTRMFPPIASSWPTLEAAIHKNTRCFWL